MFRAVSLALTLFVPGILHAYEMEDVKRIDFEVRDPDNRELFFAGTETITAEGPVTRKETWYYDLKKTEVQYENVVYQNQSLRVDSYRFKNPVTGEETDLVTQGDTMKIKYRPDSTQTYKDGTLTWEANAYHGKVFNNLILRNWESLRQGKPLKFELVLPSRFEALGFQIVYKNKRKVDGEDREIFALQPTSLIIRTLAPRMEFHYTSGAKPRIRQFTGPCTIPIQGKKDRMVDIIFSYPQT
ncbi:MAG TPA: hypothetical protein VFO10_10250 [Oligoflexus sp.]|uniref:hypothetical protein n=1 Tax=Oligoflexus sp. TaxID=1971216 RepID=UPI002D7EBA09|nr:hypothetical protein [Oligoflexus sp.]HET9237623.1 hypothetical protein [Oligoflexus sp.]